MRALRSMMIKLKDLAILKKKKETLWNTIYNRMISKEELNLGRWEHRQNENQKEIKSIWANSDHCGDRICGQPELIKEITNIKKN